MTTALLSARGAATTVRVVLLAFLVVHYGTFYSAVSAFHGRTGARSLTMMAYKGAHHAVTSRMA